MMSWGILQPNILPDHQESHPQNIPNEKQDEMRLFGLQQRGIPFYEPTDRCGATEVPPGAPDHDVCEDLRQAAPHSCTIPKRWFHL